MIYILTFILITIIFVILLVIYLLRKKQNLKRILMLSFLKITLPKKDSELDERQETTKDFKEMIWIQEQLYSSLKSIYSWKIIKRIIWQEIISFEYIAHEDEIFFYIVIPKNYKDLIEKQINWFYPDAIIEETQEINIFKARKYIESSYINIKKEFFYPIKTYQKLESDPINSITNALSKLWENESAVIQIILKPTENNWKEKCENTSTKILKWKKTSFSLNPIKIIIYIINMIIENWEDNKNNNSNNNDTTSALTQERAKIVDEKGSKTWFEVIIRIIVSWNNYDVVNSEIKNIISSFSQFTYPNFNRFKSTSKHSKTSILKNYIYRNFKKPFFLKIMILNTEELASIFHFPHIRYNKTPEIKWQNFKIIKAPKNIPKEWITLWYNIHRWVKKEIKIKTEDRFRHFYVIWQTGTWKSSILEVMIRQDFKNWDGVAVIDPHWELVHNILPFIPKERADDLIYFDTSDLDRPMWLNLLEAETSDEKELISMDALNIMIKLFGNEVFWPRIQDYFRNWVLTLMDYPSWWAITDLIRLFTDENFQKDHIKYIKNPIVKAWWQNTYANMWRDEKQEIIPYFAAKFGQFITNKTIRNILWQIKSSFDVFELMQNKKILLVNLSKWRIWDLNSKLLWMILVSKIQTAAMRRDKILKEDRKDFFLYIDEFQNYVTDSIESILSEARKYRLSLNIAHQYLWQLEQSDALTKSSLNLKQAIFWNVWTIMTYKIWPEDWEFMSKYYTPSFSNQDLMNMDKFKWVIKLSIDNQPSTPFSIIPLNPFLEHWNPKLAKIFIELSKLKYWRDKNFVSKEIEYRIWIN